MADDRAWVMEAVHALTGQWLDDAAYNRLQHHAGSREELLAHGVIDLQWLKRHPQVFARFQTIATNAAVSPDPLVYESAKPAPYEPCLPREEILRVLAQFAEEPTAVHPFERLRGMAVATQSNNF